MAEKNFFSELRNVIERSLILSQGETLEISLGFGERIEAESPGLLSLDEIQRRHIRRVPESVGGRIKGQREAAEILGMTP